MRLLLTNDDHFKFLNECVDEKPEKVLIATHNLYAGIQPDGGDSREWGEKYRSETREFLERMRSLKDVRILVGNYEHKSCKGKKTACVDCEKQYVLGLVRHINHAEKFPEFKWRISSGSHIKCALFTYPGGEIRGVAGGRNLTDSSWADVTVELDKMSSMRLFEHFVGVWKQATLLNSDRIGEIMEQQGISEQTVQSILASV
jgi:hypothetical protein